MPHTPGPWTVVPYGDGTSRVVCRDEGGEWRICFMATPGESPGAMETIEADSHLIAAAPELYEALVRMVNAWEPDSPGTDYDTWMDAKAALARACGEND